DVTVRGQRGRALRAALQVTVDVQACLGGQLLTQVGDELAGEMALDHVSHPARISADWPGRGAGGRAPSPRSTRGRRRSPRSTAPPGPGARGRPAAAATDPRPPSTGRS